jgi:hypothetical protein
MLAAHRRGGRTSLASFAHAWDRYTRAGKGPRPASERELRTLRTMLEASIAVDAGPAKPFDEAIAEHNESKARNAVKRPTGETDRSGELQHRVGWAWTRLFRRYDAYEVALEQLREAEGEREPERELV